MSDNERMPIDWPPERMWVLSDDRLTVRLQLPSLPVEGVPKPIDVSMDFDAATVDARLERLVEVRARMLPPPN